MTHYRNLNAEEIDFLSSRGCTSEDWTAVTVHPDIDLARIRHARFSGTVKIGCFNREFEMPGGLKKHSGINMATLHNVEIGDNCLIENVKNYIANYRIGSGTFIENVDIILVDKPSSFGNGVEVSVLNETGGREVTIHDHLSAHEAYMEAMYRHRPNIVGRLKEMAREYADSVTSATGTIGENVTIVDAGYIKNVNIGSFCQIEGAGRLKNGTIRSTEQSPVHIGYGVILDDFIIQSGCKIEDGSILSRCFIGQNCTMGHTYSASDSLFFSNCQGENGEACAIFAGPFTVTHHKSTLLIAGIFSFMNAGSGSNQSNHMYKLGPIHQGALERGAKTSSDSYILWPARIGAFSLVMGRHVGNVDTSDMPFSYLIERQGDTYLVPAVNLKSVGTIRDAQKWPRRDARPEEVRLDHINYNLLSPFTIQKVLRGIKVLRNLRDVSGRTSDAYTYHSAKIKNSALRRGLELYDIAAVKFLGNSVIQRLMGYPMASDADLRARLTPDCPSGYGEWVDLAGLIAPKHEIDSLITDVLTGATSSVDSLNERFGRLHRAYYDMEWTWAYRAMLEYFDLKPDAITADDIRRIVRRWLDCVVRLDNMVYADAKKEFSLSAKTGFGADGTQFDMERDFEMVRGAFESNSFVSAVQRHIEVKTELAERMLAALDAIPSA